MPVQSVVRHNDGRWMVLCSCGWESARHPAQRDAWRDKAHHARDHDEVGGVVSER